MKFSMKILYASVYLIAICFTSNSFATDSKRINTDSSIEDIRNVLSEMDIPVLDFRFEKNEFPTFDVLEHPEGCVGTAVINNEYVNGSFTISIKGEVVYDSGDYVNKESGVRVKIRGNTSTASPYVKKKSYKIKLSKKADLLLRGDSDYKDKDWCILGNGSMYLNYVAGTAVAMECGAKWEPAGRHVCVIMNDKYMGSFYLLEAVKASKKRVNIEDTGYIIENDAYWWKPGEVYFKTDKQTQFVGWTFKEPDTDDFKEDTMSNIKEVISTFENALYAEEDISEMYDADSFAAWLLAHDIMDTRDGLGSNMFVVKKNYNPEDIFETKLEMGPLWDFDDSFVEDTGTHTRVYTSGSFWYPRLLKYENFVKVFKNKWDEVKGTIKENVLDAVKVYLANNPDISNARKIDRNLGLMGWTPTTTTDEDYDNLVNWFDSRLPTLSGLMDELISGIDSMEAEDVKEPSRSYDILGNPVGSDYKGIVIIVQPDGKSKKVIRK